MIFMELNMSVVRVEFDSFQKFDSTDLGCCLGSGSQLDVWLCQRAFAANMIIQKRRLQLEKHLYFSSYSSRDSCCIIAPGTELDANSYSVM